MSLPVRTFRCHYRIAGGHVHARIFVGFTGETFASAGNLTLSVEEFCDFRRVAEAHTDGPPPVAWEFIPPPVVTDDQLPEGLAEHRRDPLVECEHGPSSLITLEKFAGTKDEDEAAALVLTRASDHVYRQIPDGTNLADKSGLYWPLCHAVDKIDALREELHPRN